MSRLVKEFKTVKFSQTVGRDFQSTLNKRVRAYFKDNGISKYANFSMVIKTIFMIGLYFIPLGIVLSGQITEVALIALMYGLMGLGMAGIGMSVMHDANHGAYSKNKAINKWIGKIINLIGGYVTTWKIQHNVLHHSFTNIHGYDEDIAPPPFLRFSPNDKLKKHHKYQHYYVWFLYSLMTVSWVTAKDFLQLFRYKKMQLTKNENKKFSPLLFELFFSKIFYYTTVIILPLLILPISWWAILLLVLFKNLISGFLLSTVFQPAHVVPETEFIKPGSNNVVENNFAIHQMQTTANFAPKSKIFSWFIGGLNHQVEHHLFPNICHVHYRNISRIVKETANEYKIPYNSHRTFLTALIYHTKMIKSLGKV